MLCGGGRFGVDLGLCREMGRVISMWAWGWAKNIFRYLGNCSTNLTSEEVSILSGSIHLPIASFVSRTSITSKLNFVYQIITKQITIFLASSRGLVDKAEDS